MIQSLKKTEFKNFIMFKTVFKTLKNYSMKVKSMSMIMFEVMCTIMSEKMTLNRGGSLSLYEISALIGCLNEGTIKDMGEIEGVLTDMIMNNSVIENLFEQLTMDKTVIESK